MPKIKTVLFDLDGTLADTAPDLADALNQVLITQKKEPLAFETIRPVVSHGGQALIKLGFDLEIGQPGFDELRQQLLDIYANNIAVKTRLFDGMAEVLNELTNRQLNWGVVTNKPAWLTNPLMEALGLSKAAATIVSGDTLPERKPHPAPLLYACKQAGSQAQECVYVGDAQRDIDAGNAAGMHTLVALFGYIGENDKPESWEADALIQSPQEIISWFISNNS